MIRTALVLSAMAAAAFGGPITYSVAVIPAPSGFTNVVINGINDLGQVAGYGFNGSFNQAFIGSLSGGTAIPLPAGWTSSYGAAVNDSGQVAGYGYNGTAQQAFIGTTSGSSPIPFPSGLTSSIGSAVNNSGQVLVHPSSGGPGSLFQGFIGTTSGSTVVPLPAGWTYPNVFGLNNLGQVAGWGDVPVCCVVHEQAFIGTTSGSIPIPLPPGSTDSSGAAVNDFGQVAGDASPGNGSIVQGFIGTTSGSMLIPLPAGATIANAFYVNDLGMVLGGSDAGIWIWDAADGTRFLNSLLPSMWRVQGGVFQPSLGTSGLILAQASCNGGPLSYVELSLSGSAGGNPGACPAVATPEAGTCALSGVGLLLAVVARRTVQRWC
jgi:hypothetical protein